MISLRDLPSPSTVYSAYASLSAAIMLLRTTFNQVVPLQLQNLVISTIYDHLFRRKNTSSTLITLVIHQNDGITPNEIYDCCEIFISTKINPHTERLRVIKRYKDKHLTLKFAQSETLVDSFHGIQITWRFVCQELPTNTTTVHHDDDDINNHLFFPSTSTISGDSHNYQQYSRHFELSFDKKHKDMVLNSYLPFVMEKAKSLTDEKKVVKLHTLSSFPGEAVWDSINLEHPSTFDKLAMEPSLKKALMDDLDRFLGRKEYYKKVGRTWKRGYLLYGPAGTGKSSLIAAMANYIKFDIYDLQLMNVRNDSCLRKLLLATANRSILVIEDIDCSAELPDRNSTMTALGDRRPRELQFTLSGLLNFIDGLWSSCGDERIIVFTTNYKERLDPALLRPGRMDVHVHMDYLSFDGFKVLAANYLDIAGHHWRFGEVEELIGSIKVTPAEVAEELMKSSDADLCLGGLVNFLKRKKMEISSEPKDEDQIDDVELPQAKRRKP